MLLACLLAYLLSKSGACRLTAALSKSARRDRHPYQLRRDDLYGTERVEFNDHVSASRNYEYNFELSFEKSTPIANADLRPIYLGGQIIVGVGLRKNRKCAARRLPSAAHADTRGSTNERRRERAGTDRGL